MRGANTYMDSSLHEIIVTPENIPAWIVVHDSSTPDVIPHWHESLELICSLDSRLEIRRNQEKILINEDEVAVINCCQIHSVVPLKAYHNHGISITFGEDFLKKHFPDTEYPIFVLDGNEAIKKEIVCDMKKMYDIYCESSKDIYANLQINSLLFHIAYCLLRYYLVSPSGYAKMPVGKYQKRYMHIMKYIRDHYSEPITLSDVANFSNLSKEHLSREFKTYVGESFREYLNTTRISKAQYELLHTDIPLIDLALKHGFTDLRSYNRAFQKYFQMSPIQFRRKYKRNEQVDKFNDKLNLR